MQGKKSIEKAILYEVPQSSVLGCLLFITFSNDLHTAVNQNITHRFADDTNLLLTGTSLKTINNHINKYLALIIKWMRASNLSLNTAKQNLSFSNLEEKQQQNI